MGDVVINAFKYKRNTFSTATLSVWVVVASLFAANAGAAENAAHAWWVSAENSPVVQAKFAQPTVDSVAKPTPMEGAQYSQLIGADFAAPMGDVILTVSGKISMTNVGDAAQFDLDALMALPKTEYITSTIWTDGDIRFTGVALTDLMQALGADPDSIVAKALNDYSITISKDDIGPDYPMIAYHMDGETFSRREKGPLWVVFPYDRSEDFKQELVYGLSVWQLETLTVE